MNCRRADQLFSAAWEDELSLAERETLETHIESCAACRRSYDEFTRVMEAVQGMPKAEASADFADGVWSRIRAAEQPAARRRRVLAGGWGGWWTVSFRPALAAAACLVVVGAAVVMWNSNNRVPNIPQNNLRADNSAPSVAKDVPPSPMALRSSSEKSENLAASPSRREIAKKAKLQSVAAGQLANEAAGAPASQEEPLADEKQSLAKAEGPSITGTSLGAPVALRSQALQYRAARVRDLAFASPDSAALYDSVFNHEYDVEFALDPVHLKKSAQGKLSPARPVQTDTQGQRAKFTF